MLVGFGFGGALLAMFMRVGGGIFTKAADVGADLVGKVEQGIPEDDPRNAATIADNVGDNVGDCAGMAADLFESYEVTLIASLILGAAAFAGSEQGAIAGVMFPLFVRAIGVITSIIGILAVTPRSENEHGMKAINRGLLRLGAHLRGRRVRDLRRCTWTATSRPSPSSIGLVLAVVIQVLTQYFTDTKYRPVQEIAESTVTGPATTILSGFSIGLESTVWSALILAGGHQSRPTTSAATTAERLVLHLARPAWACSTTVGVIVSMDTYGPISDNAQGIAEMSGRVRGASGRDPRRPRRRRQLDEGHHEGHGDRDRGASPPPRCSARSRRRCAAPGSSSRASASTSRTCWSGCCSAARVAFLFSLAGDPRRGPRRARRSCVEVRKQFRDHPGIMDYSEKPDYGAVVDICTKTSLRELMTPGLLAVLSPVIAGFFLKAEALGAFLAGAILTGQLLAVMLSNAGGAWDNAKKYIEDGNYGGKGSESHKAAVIGDTVGDPFKDTAGPALNPLIKVMNLVALLIAPLVVTHADDIALRIAICVVIAAVLGVMIYVSKSRKSELREDIAAANAPKANV